MKQPILYLVVCTLLLLDAASAEKQYGMPILLALKNGSTAVVDSAIKRIAENGGRILHVYPPHVLIGFLPFGKEAIVEAKLPGTQSYRGEITEKDGQQFGEAFTAVFESWNNNFQGKAKARGLNPSPSEYTPPVPTVDALAVPRDGITEGGSAMNRPQGAGYYDVSEFLMGRISVNVILPESDGSIDTQTENWTSTKEQQVVSEIQAGMSWLASQDSRANLTFVYNFYYGRTDSRARTGYEPISRSSTQQSLWMNQIMANFGYASGTEFDRAFGFLNNAIWWDNTDWGVLIWVADSESDPNGRFDDGKFAYAYVGGPFLVMTYDNDNWGIGKMDAVVSHEFEHNFHTLDEYAEATNQPCTMYSGYLNVQNRNSANATNCGSDLNLPCVMRSGDNVSGICTYTRQMLGWRDTDGNNIFDIADTYPATTLNPLVPNPTYDKTPTFTGSGADVPLTNQNPYPFFHFGPRNNISPNPVTEFWWRVDAGAWVAYPSAFTSFTTSPLPNGAHTFELKARNALGRFDQTPEVQNFTELGHLYSTSSTVTSANSQRRISRDETGVYHVAYSDENIIYYTSSTDNGTTWSTEEVIPAYSFFPKTYPAVATHLSHVFVVWQEYEGVVNGKHQYRIKGVWKQPGSAWRQMMAYGSSNSPLIARFSSPNDPLPTLVAADNTYNERAPTSPPHPELMCAWRNEDGIYSAVGSWDVIPSCCGPGDGEDEILSQEYVWNPNVRFGKIANTSGYCVNPSLGTDFLNRVGLAFDEAGLIYATLNDGAGWSAREQVSIPALTSEPSHYPSATFDNSSRLIVTWKSEDWEFGGQDIEVRRREVSGGWNVITMFGEMHSYYPSVSGYPRLSGNSDFAVAFHTSQNNLQLKKYTNGAWQATQVVAATGFDAMISENNSASLDAKIAFRSTSSSPYAIAFTSQSLPTSPFTTQEDIYREVRVVADSFAIRFALGELVAKTGTASAPVSFDSFDDTTVIRGNTEITRVFRSEPFNVSAGTVLEIFHLLRVANPTWIRNTFGRNSEVALSIEAIDAETGTVLGKPATFSVKKNVIPSLRGNATLPLSPFRGRRIFVRASVQISNDLVTKPYMLEIRKPRSASSSPLARIGEVTSSGKPSNYFLADNFPNPFNPSTKIQFGLPEGAVVSLSVFDVLGCEVQQLATGYYSAGYHTITWNASDLSSGMYFARLRLTDAAGKQFFTKTNRLLLAK